MTKYTTIELTDLDEGAKAIVEAVINEGRLQVKEQVLEKIERKITEMYSQNNLEMVEFLEQLIRDLDLDL